MIIQTPSVGIPEFSYVDAENISSGHFTTDDSYQAIIDLGHIGANATNTAADVAIDVASADVSGTTGASDVGDVAMDDSSNVECVAPLLSNTHPMVTRSKVGIFKPKVYTTELSLVEPKDVYEALLVPSWKKAVDEEFQALIKNDMWELVSGPENRNLVGCKWLFKVKKKC